MRITTNRCRRKSSINQQTWRTEMPKRNRRRYNKSKMLVEKVKTSTVTISINKMKKNYPDLFYKVSSMVEIIDTR